jgi:hypothetical protein
MASFVDNIGFGHPQAKTYNAGGEQNWGNTHRDLSFRPNILPASLELIEPLVKPLNGAC